MPQLSLREAFELAVERMKAGRDAEAESICRQILAISRNDSALHLLGLLAGRAGRSKESAALIAEAISLNSRVPAYHNNHGEALRRAGRSEEAVAAYVAAIALESDFGLAYRNLGGALLELGRSDEAVTACEAAVRIDPASAQDYENLAVAFVRAGRPEDAAVAASTAIRLDTNRATAHLNLAGALIAMGKPLEAVSELRTAISLQPDLAKAHWNLGLVLLLLGDWEAGWGEYEWRWKCEGLGIDRHFSQPLWNGATLEGRTILLHAEQGLGDLLQFVRYAPLVAGRGGRVIVECHPELHRLLNGCEGISECIPGGNALPPFDVHCPILSLPRIFATRPQSVPARVPYVPAEKKSVEKWRERMMAEGYSSAPRLRVGLVWAGSATHKNDRNRSIALSQMTPLADVNGVDFFSLQRGPAADQVVSAPGGLKLIDWTAEIGDMADTAALISCMDLVISVDTAVAHLAGAMGAAVWVLLPHAPDWRWLLLREDSPWYPTMRLFRQPRRGDWASVLIRVVEQLRGISHVGKRDGIE